jgi:hypothetical protein
MSDINFYALVVKAGTKEGARHLFGQLVVELAHLVNPSVRDVYANPGDWGIDAFVGELADGESVGVWQAKFFIDGVRKAQQQEIRDSFNQCLKAAAREGYKVASWTLCIPEWMDGETTKWWDSWKKRAEREHAIVIELWHPNELRALLRSPDAEEIRAAYLGSEHRMPRALEFQPADEDFESMLFIKQLVAAEIGDDDLDSAKFQFFNADLLTRDIQEKADEREVGFLDALREEIYGLWSHRYQTQCLAGSGRLLPGLYPSVMEAIEHLHSLSASSDLVPLRLPHRWGSMHQVVETGRAGWIRDFSTIVDEGSA